MLVVIRFVEMGFKAMCVPDSSDWKHWSVLVFDRQQSALKNITNTYC